MVVICEKCQTRFRLADSKITEKGVKVRCSKCQHTFLVKKPKAGAEEALPQPPGGEAAKPSTPSPPEQSPPSGPEVPKPPAMDDQALDSAISAALSGIVDEDKKEEAPAPEESAPGEAPSPEIPDFDGGDIPFTQDQFDFADDPGSQMEGFESEEGPEEPSFGEGLDFEGAEEQAPEFKGREEPAFPPAPVEEMPFKKEELPPPKPLVPSAKLKKKKERSPALRLLLIILISGALLYGGLFTWQHREELLGLGDFGPSVGGEGKRSEEIITTLITKKYFIPRTIRGQSLFVIEGKATNDYKVSRSFIRLKGSIFNDKGELMMTEEVYAGNVISEKDLRSHSPQQVMEILNNKFGELGSNMDIPPENIVAFTIVFFDPPGEVAEVEVKVSDSQPGSQ